MTEIPVKDVTPKQKSEPFLKDREKIYVREIKGWFQKLRSVTLWALMLAYFGTVWIPYGDRPAVWFDLPSRQFHVFSATFWPQDLVLLSGILIISALALFTVTNLAGRVWCGYTCPQSAWSFIFMWIEERVEGTRNQRIKLDKAPMTANKAMKKGLKHTLWLAIALWTSLTFVGYFSPIADLVVSLGTLSLNGWEFFWLAFFCLATYINAGWMREQVCIYMCPYARFQSVMYDDDTLAVTYDVDRGEPRGKRSKKVDESTQGDCVDCSLCVQVCPTGIDIRQGLQYECIGCALCIDACNSIMDKLDKPRGLIRYTTENSLAGKPTRILRPRFIGYAILLGSMVSLLAFSLVTRTAFELDVERDRGQLYRWTVNDTVQNSFTIKLMNMSQEDASYSLRVDGLPGYQSNIQESYLLKTNERLELSISIELNPEKVALADSKTDIFFVVTDSISGEEILREESRFIAPRS